jgi:hypothetical protein
MSDLPNEVVVDMVNLKRKLAISNIGYGSITNMFDSNGDDTEDAGVAVTAVVEWFVGGYSAITLADFVNVDPG